MTNREELRNARVGQQPTTGTTHLVVAVKHPYGDYLVLKPRCQRRLNANHFLWAVPNDTPITCKRCQAKEAR